MIKSYFRNPIRMPWHLYAAVFVLLALPCVFLSMPLVSSVWTCAVYRSADFHSIVKSGSDGDYAYREDCYAYANGKSLPAEIYQSRTSAVASSGVFALDWRLRSLPAPQSGECYLSRGLALRRGVRVGDTLTVESSSIANGMPLSLKIAGFLPSIAGLEENTPKEGILLIGYNENAAEQNHYISFREKFDPAAQDVRFRSAMLREQTRAALWSAFGLFAATLLAVFALEVLFQRDKLETYRNFRRKGMAKSHLLRAVLFELTIKYAVPFTLAAFLPAAVLAFAYGAGALIFSAVLLALGAVQLAAGAAYYYFRSIRWIR